MSTLPPAREMERAWLNRDPAYQGLFLIGVKTTGIFCRPTCPARKPLPKNVEYFPNAHAASFAGYRPCKRCKPLQADDQPEWARELIEWVEREPVPRMTEGEIRKRGIDPATVRRYFLKRFGMTFQAYARSRRLSGAFSRIRKGEAVEQTVRSSGYDSESGFREAYAKLFGESPGSHAKGDCVRLAWMESPLGPLVAGATEQGICLLEFTDRRMIEAQFQTVRTRMGLPLAPGSNAHLKQLQKELADYFEGQRQSFTVPLVYPGTDFQRRIWNQLLTIPYGETRSYQEIAGQVGDAKAVRAVGRANGLNRIAIVIPCHRVVNKNGELGGYGGGLRRKQYLLDLERKQRDITRGKG
ncbi:MAG: methylated-DNA--[protein]-cysteine S-methyltransferase [Gemmataceae bacterium]